MFEIEINEAARIIHVRMLGPFTAEGAQACAAAKEAAVDSLGPPYDQHSTIVDIRDFRVQPQEIFAIFTDFVARTPHKSRKIAILGGEGTARMQFRRVAERDPLREDMRYFTEFGDAQDWLAGSAA
jgi:hypothetical protein